MRRKSELSGLLGDVISVRKVRGRIIITAQKPRVPKATAKLKKVRERFRQAAQYAVRQVEDAEIRKMYSRGVTAKRHTPYLVALSDYLNAPKVDAIDTTGYHGVVGDVIVIQAKDDFMVTSVIVKISDAAGLRIEHSNAVQEKITGHWEYRVTVANTEVKGTTIKAIAYDRPGNEGKLEVKV